jgi:hypothetical protein
MSGKPRSAYVFSNHMMIVFDWAGEQVPEYQGQASECAPRLRRDFPACPITLAGYEGGEHPIVDTGVPYEEAGDAS